MKRPVIALLFVLMVPQQAKCSLELLTTTLKNSVENLSKNISANIESAHQRYNSTLCFQQILDICDGFNSNQKWAIESEYARTKKMRKFFNSKLI